MAIPSKVTTHPGEGSRRQQPGDGGACRHLLLDGAVPAAGGRAAAMLWTEGFLPLPVSRPSCSMQCIRPCGWGMPRLVASGTC